MTVALIGYVPQLDPIVALATCSDTPVPGANTVKSHASVWPLTGPVIAQVPGPPNAGLMTQLMPGPGGSGAVSVVALLGVDWLTIEIVNPIGMPAVTRFPSRCTVALMHGASLDWYGVGAEACSACWPHSNIPRPGDAV